MIELKNEDIKNVRTKARNSERNDCSVTFIYHKNSKRIVFSSKLLDMFGSPEKISFKFMNDYLIIIFGDENGFTVKGGKTIYNAGLIKEILENFNIKYDGNFCHTFSEFEEISNITNAIALKMC